LNFYECNLKKFKFIAIKIGNENDELLRPNNKLNLVNSIIFY